MNIEQLIKEIIDGIAGIDWSPGTYPQRLNTIRQSPAGAWSVTTGSGLSTSTRRMATIETSVQISIWASNPALRATCKSAVMAAFAAFGFLALVPSDAEVVIEAETTAYVSSMTFRAWIDTVTGWVYQNQNS